MNWYFIVLVSFGVLGLGITLARHGEMRTDKHNFWIALVGFTLNFTLTYFAVKQGF